MLSIYIKLKVEIEMNNKEIKFSNTKGFRGFLLIGGLAFLIIMGYFYIGGLIKANRLKSDCTETTTGLVYTYPYSGRNSGLMEKRVGAHYEVNGRTYSVMGIDSVDHRPNEEITVHYNPGNPEDGYAGNAPYHISHLIGALSLFFGLMMIVAFFKLHAERS